MNALFIDVAAVLRAHELVPASLKTGETVWRCKTCDQDWLAIRTRHAVAQSEHQAAILESVRASSGTQT